MMKIQAKLDHANHNADACNYLHQETYKKYSDWVITTAFYAALHYCEYLFFPYSWKVEKTETMTFSNIDELFEYFKREMENKRSFRKRWLRNKFSEISPIYNALYDQCQTARYHEYFFDNEEAKIAIMRMKEIQKFCSKAT
jgi:hypothetical protein